MFRMFEFNFAIWYIFTGGDSTHAPKAVKQAQWQINDIEHQKEEKTFVEIESR